MSVVAPLRSALASALLTALVDRGWPAEPGAVCSREVAWRGRYVVVTDDDIDTVHLDVPTVLGRPGVVVVTSVQALSSLVPLVDRGALVLDRAAPFLVLLGLVELGLAGRCRNDSEAVRRRAAEHCALATLTDAERVTLRSLAAGLSAATIATGSHHSVHTVRSHIRSILVKLGVQSQLAAVAVARRAGPEWDASNTLHIATFGDVRP
ncbi:helix-turn-helix transcriptional regulator [Sanguibacter antarcticus]|uniref:helix-turn-helix transcriptional regulator n=1 Tax=Sanguibacter antarcticus TaxID=372484 RepID=UPI001475C15A|nr:LuxR C-terminal-related transcriptional regulator [Sanguibacter antarcticus]